MGDRVQRLQMKWAITALTVSLAALVVTSVAAAATNRAPEAPLTIYAFAGTLVPLAIGIAILRHRLYDIDRILSRTIVYGVVSSLLFITFVIVNLGLQRILSGLTGNDWVRVATSTLVAAALFNPLRHRVQVAVDRRFHRSHVDAAQAVEALAGRLRNEVDLQRVTVELRRAAVDAVDPATTRVWLRAGRATCNSGPGAGTWILSVTGTEAFATAPRPLGLAGRLLVGALVVAGVIVGAPLRRRVQRAVDRRFNRAGYDAQRAAAVWLRGGVG